MDVNQNKNIFIERVMISDYPDDPDNLCYKWTKACDARKGIQRYVCSGCKSIREGNKRHGILEMRLLPARVALENSDVFEDDGPNYPHFCQPVPKSKVFLCRKLRHEVQAQTDNEFPSSQSWDTDSSFAHASFESDKEGRKKSKTNKRKSIRKGPFRLNKSMILAGEGQSAAGMGMALGDEAMGSFNHFNSYPFPCPEINDDPEIQAEQKQDFEHKMNHQMQQNFEHSLDSTQQQQESSSFFSNTQKQEQNLEQLESTQPTAEGSLLSNSNRQDDVSLYVKIVENFLRSLDPLDQRRAKIQFEQLMLDFETSKNNSSMHRP